MRIMRAYRFVIAAVCGWAAWVVPAFAASGSLDPTFGSFGVEHLMPMRGSALVILADGKVIVAGTAADGFVLTRLAADGSVDATFGDTGVARRSVPAAAGAVTLVVQPDGKLLLATVLQGPAGPSIALARFDAQGNSDVAFGAAGIVTTRFTDPANGSGLLLTGVALDANGRIMVGAAFGRSFHLMRYTASGSLDGSFGSGGVVAAANDVAVTYGPILQADGRMLAFGTTGMLVGFMPNDLLTVLRFQADGTPDATFGPGGRSVLAFARGGLTVTHAVLQSDGRMLVSGIAPEHGAKFALWLARITPDGALDTTYNAGGTSLIPLGTDRLPNAHFETWLGGGARVAITPDGGTVQVGSAYDGFGFVYALVRRTPDGSLDPSFGHGGRILGPPGTGGAEGSAIDATGSRVWVTGAFRTDPASLPVARFVLAPTPATIGLASSANPTPSEQPVSVTATIARTGSASGTMSFLDDGLPIQGCGDVAVITPPASPSIATCSVTLTSGLHAVTAAYSGDALHPPQTSDALIQRVTPVGTTTLIEFFNARLGDYFLTSAAGEIVALDSGVTPGWSRTGESFLAFALDAGRVKAMCRWFSGASLAPVSVHFYSVSEGECYRPPGDWVFEANVAAALLPQPAGFCPTGTTQLYRLYNNSQDGVPRHRTPRSSGYGSP